LDELFVELQQTFGSTYTVKRELRGGGMARVFVAHDETLGREVIVKVLPPELTYGFSAARFTREFKLAATLQEPHIVPVLTAGQTTSGLPFYTMPFVRGESLRVYIRRGRIPLEECLTILHDIARALAYAHKQGIVHRDIKPENILLSEGTAVVTDFGIAKAVQAAMTATPPEPGGGGGAAITLPGDTVGTPAYMSPEQAAADPTTDQRADIYAWGVVAYELLTGKHPFAEKTGSPQALLTAQMSDTPPLISVANPTVPRPIADLVLSCLSKTAALRPANGAALLAALDDPSTAQRPRISFDRLGRRGVLFATLVVVVMLIGATLWRVRAASARPPLIAVLPFDTEGEGADSGFADGLRDAVTGKLARLTGLSVNDRKSVLSLAASPPTSAQQAGKSLGADYVLQASVRWAKGANGQPLVRVSPTLMRVSDGTTRWAGEPEIVSPADPFTIQASVATRVAEALDVVMAARERKTMARRATSDTGAFAAVIRGKRITDENRTSSYREYERALRYFETAYQRDPDYADALGLAGQALAGMSYAGGAKLLDSATVLAQRALDLDPTQVNAVATLAFRGFGRPAEALGILQQALRENPSSIDLLTYEQRALVFVGDSAGAWEAVQRILPLAPASKSVLATCFRTALALRRYGDAKDLVARERALDPAALGPIFDAATLSAKLGDRGAVGEAVLELESRGGRLGASDGEIMRNGDTWLQNELATGSLASYAPGSAIDSVSFYAEKAELFMTRGDYARARGLADSAWRLEKRMADDPKQSTFVRRTQYEVLAWLAALHGDRPTALSMLRQAGESPTITMYPDGVEAVQLTCTKAAVYGFLRDVDAMLPFAQRCFTKANGYPIAYLNDPEFARNRGDPRFKALVGKLANPR
jgi:TolB-like protein/tRNA A-37 threonylcarbamoyl transferase component Bud32/tetratricopeptide (TPR) repeat protein